MNISTIMHELNEKISENMDVMKDYTDEEILELIETVVFEKSRDTYLSTDEKHKIITAIFNSRRRLDIIQPLLDDDTITEIMINGPDNIFIEKEGAIYKTDLKFEQEDKLYSIVQAIVSKVNRSVNEASPIVDARLKDGSRINVVLPPIALNGPAVTIRKFPQKPLTMERLVELGAISREAADFLRLMVLARYNIFICGSTGSGKTTFLNALSNFIPGRERIITIEDSAELKLIGAENLISLETRNPNTEGKGEISIRELIRTSLRMRPDRIIVGEVRGPEALDMLQAMNTGHEGSLSTGHANSCKDMLSRLETMVLTGALLPLDAIRQQIASAIDIIIHLGRLRDTSRKVLEISEISGYENGEIKLNPLFVFEEIIKKENLKPDDSLYLNEGILSFDKSVINTGKVEGWLVRTGNKLINTLKLKMAGLYHEQES